MVFTRSPGTCTPAFRKASRCCSCSPLPSGSTRRRRLVHFAFLVALAWQMVRYARRAGFPRLGICAALLVFASPVVGKDATSAYNDAALACVAFTLFSLLQAWDEERTPIKLLIPIGLIAGFAYAIKYTGGVGNRLCNGVRGLEELAEQGSAAPLLTVSACSRLWSTGHPPWMVKNWLWVHNPVSPFFNHLFPNPYRNDLVRKRLPAISYPLRFDQPMADSVGGSRERASLWASSGPSSCWRRSRCLALRRREGRQLLLAAAVFGSTYFGNIGARFLIPPLPFVALAMMLGLANRALATGGRTDPRSAIVAARSCRRYARRAHGRFTNFPYPLRDAV